MVFSKQYSRKDYVKLHGLLNLETRALETFEVTEGTEHDCTISRIS
jgi:hypothetical protein